MGRDLSGRIELQAAQLATTSTTLQQTSMRLDSVAAHGQQLGLDLTNQGGTLEKLSERLELAHEYCHGVSKGFQDTQKRMCSQDSILRPDSPLLNAKGDPGSSKGLAAKPQLSSESGPRTLPNIRRSSGQEVSN